MTHAVVETPLALLDIPLHLGIKGHSVSPLDMQFTHLLENLGHQVGCSIRSYGSRANQPRKDLRNQGWSHRRPILRRQGNRLRISAKVIDKR
jgi:hypothetical protein